MAFDIYTSTELARIMYDERIDVSTSGWRSMFFTSTFMSTQEEIMFDKIKKRRGIAPFMLPNMPGKPIFRREGERIESFKPAYTKPKDSVRPSEAIQKTAKELATRSALLTPEARYAQAVVDIVTYQRQSIENLWDYMAAKVLIDGQITINYDSEGNIAPGVPSQTVVLDFGRDPSHNVTLTPGNYWSDAGVDPLINIEDWVERVAVAEFGGGVRDIIMGAKAATAFRRSEAVKQRMNKDFAGTENFYVQRGLVPTDPLNPFTLIGQMDDGTNIWRYTDHAPANDALKNVLAPEEVLLVAPNVDGIQAFGAILDEDARLQAMPIFSKMWSQKDPSARFIMSQSAPLMIPTNPNCTLKARVLA